jgi:hypothetical protein
MRFLGMSYRQIARRQGLTTAGAEARHERGMRLFPPLRALFARKMVKRGLRRKPGEGSEAGGGGSEAGKERGTRVEVGGGPGEPSQVG